MPCYCQLYHFSCLANLLRGLSTCRCSPVQPTCSHLRHSKPVHLRAFPLRDGNLVLISDKRVSVSSKSLLVSGKGIFASVKPVLISHKPVLMPGKQALASSKPVPVSGRLVPTSGKPVHLRGSLLRDFSNAVAMLWWEVGDVLVMF